MYLTTDSEATVTNCILLGDTGGEIIVVSSSTAIVTYCDVEGVEEKDHNINAPPLFMSISYLHLSKGFTPGTTSPCIDAGNKSALPADVADLGGDGNITETVPYDLDGNDRSVGDTVDMGAYEVQ